MTTTPLEERRASARKSKPMPGEGIDVAKMPGHWVLARLGKRVLRPGGLELTRWMVDNLSIGLEDRVVEFAPGLGRTAQIVLERDPASYTAVERDDHAADTIRGWLGVGDDRRRIVNGLAQDTGLPDTCATVLYVEAMLTMQPDTRRREILAEAFRLLEPGGRFGMHEVSVDTSGEDAREKLKAVRQRLGASIHHQVHPLPADEWIGLLESVGFRIEATRFAPMRLLEPGRLIRDEGLFGTARFIGNLLTHGPERRRVMKMRQTFRSLRPNLKAIGLVAVKPNDHPSVCSD